MKVMIAMSGGVDSTVAAYLMQKQGAECIGATMRLVGSSLPGVCGNDESIHDAENACKRLGIPFHIFDMQEEFRKYVVDTFAQKYEQGLTPNPCIECNKHLKFDLFLKKATELGCDHIVTGHYARIRQDAESGRYLLSKAADEEKDQSYFLYGLTQAQLAHTLFPLGELRKSQVRVLAEECGFVNAHKHDSQDICFIPDGDYKTFLQKYTGNAYRPGDYIDLQGNVLGRHSGAVGYTVGQRKGLGIALGKPAYVCKKDMAQNTVTLGENKDLFSSVLWANCLNFLPWDALSAPLKCTAKVRSRHLPHKATAYPEADGRMRIEFDQPQRALTAGQAVVLYDGDDVIGGGTIIQAG